MTTTRTYHMPASRLRALSATTLAALVFAAQALAGEIEVVPVSGPKQSGELRELSVDRLVVQSADGPKTFNPKELKSVQFPAAASEEQPALWLEVIDGSRLAATTYQAADGKAQVELLGGQKIEVPTRSIRFVRYRLHQGELASQWDEIVKSNAAGDVLVKRNKTTRTVEEPGQEPKQVTEESLDQLEGTVLEVTATTARFDFEGDTIDVKLDRIDGIIYFHPVKRELPSAACQVVDVNRNQWTAKSIELKQDRLSVVSVAGVAVEIPVGQLAKIDFSSGNVKYLAELEPESTLAEASFQPRNMTATFKQLKLPRGRPFGGQAITIGGETFEQGLALGGRTKLSYQIPEGMRWFRATAGLDDLAGPAASVTLRVLGDNRELFSHTFSAREDERAKIPIELELAGIRRLSIVTEDGDGLDIADQVDLAEARFTK